MATHAGEGACNEHLFYIVAKNNSCNITCCHDLCCHWQGSKKGIVDLLVMVST